MCNHFAGVVRLGNLFKGRRDAGRNLCFQASSLNPEADDPWLEPVLH